MELPPRRSNFLKSPSQFLRLGEAGSGGYSTVYQVQDPSTGRRYALKTMDMRKLSKKNMENIIKEIRSHGQMNHPNIIEFIDHLQVGDSIFLLLALAEKGNLFNYMNKIELSNEQIARIFVQMCLAVEHIHSKGFIHRDLKPENILLDENLDARLGDFGWCAHLSDTAYRYQSAGTYEYMSPEALSGKAQGKEADIWALGVLLYELFHNKEPFPGRNAKEVSDSIKHKHVEFFKDTPQEAIDLIVKILSMDPAKRPSIRKILEHPFILKYYKNGGIPPSPQYVADPSPEKMSPATQTRIFSNQLKDITHSPVNNGGRGLSSANGKDSQASLEILNLSPPKASPIRPVTVIRQQGTHPHLQRFMMNGQDPKQSSPSLNSNPHTSASGPINPTPMGAVHRFTPQVSGKADSGVLFEFKPKIVSDSGSYHKNGMETPKEAYVPSPSHVIESDQNKNSSSSPKKMTTLRKLTIDQAGGSSPYTPFMDLTSPQAAQVQHVTAASTSTQRLSPEKPVSTHVGYQQYNFHNTVNSIQNGPRPTSASPTKDNGTGFNSVYLRRLNSTADSETSQEFDYLSKQKTLPTQSQGMTMTMNRALSPTTNGQGATFSRTLSAGFSNYVVSSSNPAPVFFNSTQAVQPQPMQIQTIPGSKVYTPTIIRTSQTATGRESANSTNKPQEVIIVQSSMPVGMPTMHYHTHISHPSSNISPIVSIRSSHHTNRLN